MSLFHSIPLCSVHNARELGGYAAADGKKIKNGVLLRTANLSKISEDDVRLLTDTYRLRHIVDFRMAMEMAGADDPPISGAEYHHLDVIDLSKTPPGDLPDVDVSKLDLIQMLEISEQFGMLDGSMYIGFLSSDAGKEAFSRFFRILLSAEPDRAVLWHCTSGKDRTGLAAMLLLSLFGVEEGTVVQDYLLTNVYNAKRIMGTKQYLKAKGYDDELINKAIFVFDAVDEQNIRTSIAWLKKVYGSVIDYIRDGLMISQEEIETLKEKYLV